MYQVRAPNGLDLKVKKEYGNKKDDFALMVWLPELKEIPIDQHEVITDKKRKLKLRQVAGLPMGHVPFIMSEALTKCLDQNLATNISW